jgi:hypothetical protein
MEGLLC